MHANLSKSFYIAYLLLALNKINNKRVMMVNFGFRRTWEFSDRETRFPILTLTLNVGM